MSTITTIALAFPALSLLAALVTFAALAIGKHEARAWLKCPECNWHHRGTEFQLTLPPGEAHAGLRKCTCCETIQRIEHQKKFTHSMRKH